MEVLKASEYYLKMTGLLAINEKRCSAVIAYALNALYLCMLVFLCYMTAAFVYYHSDDIIASYNAIMIFCGTFMVAAIYFFLRMNRGNLKELMRLFRRTADKAPAAAKDLYEATEAKRKRFTDKAVKSMMIMAFVVFGLSSVISAVTNIAAGNLDTTTWFRPFQVEVPYDHHTILEYLVYAPIFYNMSYCYMMTQTTSLTFFMNSCALIETEYSHFKMILADVNALVGKRGQVDTKTLKRHLIDAVGLHIELQRSVDCLSKIMSGPLFFQLSCNVVYSAACLNLMETGMSNISMAVESICCIMVALFWLYLYCYYSTRITVILALIGEEVYQLNWHAFPMTQQLYLTFMIRQSQREFQFNCLRIFNCNLEIFVTIMRTTGSYYLMLRNFNEY